MKKRLFLSLALAALAGGGVFAQTHFVSTELSILGAGARYEYVITPEFTLCGYIFYNYLPVPFLPDETVIDHRIFGTGTAARWYPGGRKFFVELGLGYSIYTAKHRDYKYKWPIGEYTEEVSETWSAFSIVPGFGWTIDIGAPGGLFISPSIRAPFTFTQATGDIGLGKGVFPSGIFAFGVGYAFF